MLNGLGMNSSLRRIFTLDLRSLALFRIVFATVLLFDLFWRSRDLAFFYSDNGVWSRALAFTYEEYWSWSLHFMSGGWEFQALLFCIAAAVNLALLLGWRTKLMTVLAWVFIVSLHRRNSMVLQGGDTLLRALAFWAMFLPLGERWSLDARTNGGARHTKIASVATACFMFQLAIVYIFSFWWKTGNAWVKDYDAVYYALSVDQFTSPIGMYLLQFPKLLTALTIGTLILEGIGPLLLFVPFWTEKFRTLAITAFLIFHTGLLWSMELGPFPYVCISGWLALIPSTFWDDFLSNRAVPEGEAWPAPMSLFRRERIFYRLQSAALIFFLANVICWNLRTLHWERWHKIYLYKYNFILVLVGLDQTWGMFSPYPINWDGWYLVTGETRRGRKVNLTPGSKPDDPISDERPSEIARMYRTERIRKYHMSLADSAGAPIRPMYAQGLINRWNESNRRDRLKSVDIYFFMERTLKEGSSPPEKMHLLHYDSPRELKK